MLRDLLLGPEVKEELPGGSSSLLHTLSYYFISCSPSGDVHPPQHCMAVNIDRNLRQTLSSVLLSLQLSINLHSAAKLPVFAFTPRYVFGSHRPRPSAPTIGNTFYRRRDQILLSCLVVGLVQGTTF